MYRFTRPAITVLLAGCQLSLPPASRPATTPGKDELEAARLRALARFEAQVLPPMERTGFVVLANHDPVQRNARRGRPLTIAGQAYQRGLYCHAVSTVEVQLPGPARAFRALKNDCTTGTATW